MTGGKPQWPHEDVYQYDDGLPQWSLDVSDTLLMEDWIHRDMYYVSFTKIIFIKKSFNCDWTVYLVALLKSLK